MNEFADIIAQLEQKRASIEKALEALRGVEAALPPLARKRGRPPKAKGGLSQEGRKSLSENMRKRWAIKRAQASGKKATVKKRAVSKAA